MRSFTCACYNNDLSEFCVGSKTFYCGPHEKEGINVHDEWYDESELVHTNWSPNPVKITGSEYANLHKMNHIGIVPRKSVIHCCFFSCAYLSKNSFWPTLWSTFLMLHGPVRPERLWGTYLIEDKQIHKVMDTKNTRKCPKYMNLKKQANTLAASTFSTFRITYRYHYLPEQNDGRHYYACQLPGVMYATSYSTHSYTTTTNSTGTTIQWRTKAYCSSKGLLYIVYAILWPLTLKLVTLSQKNDLITPKTSTWRLHTKRGQGFILQWVDKDWCWQDQKHVAR